MGKRSFTTQVIADLRAKRRRVRSGRSQDIDLDSAMDIDASRLRGPTNAHTILNTFEDADTQFEEEPNLLAPSQRSSLPVEADNDDEITPVVQRPSRSRSRRTRTPEPGHLGNGSMAIDNLTNGSYPDQHASIALEDNDDDMNGHVEREGEMDEDDEDNDTPVQSISTRKGLASCGILSSIRLDRFMSHKCFQYDLGPNVNILNGKNGSGKSAIVAALQLGLGGKAGVTDRGDRLDKHITYGQNSAIITLNILNQKSPDVADMTYKWDVYGDMITVERKLFRGKGSGAGSSAWVVKNRKGQQVKLPEGVTPRKEAMNIFHHFGFMAHNPVAFLTQDNSKKFLAKGKATAHYKLYREATLLDPLDQEISETLKILHQITDMVKKADQNRPKTEDKLANLEREHNEVQQMHGLQDRIRKTIILVAWTAYHEQLDKLKRCEAIMTDEIEPKEARLRVKLQQDEAKYKATSEEVRLESQKLNELTEKSTHATNARRAAQIEHNKIKADVTIAQQKITQLKEDISNTQRSIDREHERMEVARTQHFKGQEQKTRLIEELKQVQIDEKRAVERIEKEKQDVGSYDEQRFKLRDEENQLQDRCRRLEMERESKYREYVQSQRHAQSRNNLARFNTDIPTIVDIIKRHSSKFQIPPIGPLGHYIKLKDESWALAIEQSVQRNTLCSFLVLDSHDERVLRSLLPRGIRRPNIYIMNLRSARYSISPQNVPDVARFGMCTILDQVIIENDTVFNALVDFANVEQVVLNDKVDITRLAWSDTPNVKSVWNKAGEHATTRGGSKVFRSAPRNNSAHLLTSDMSRYIESLKREADEIGKEAQKAKESIEENKRKQSQVSYEAQGYKQRMQDAQKQRYDLERKRHGIEDQLSRAEDAFNPTPYERQIETLQQRMVNDEQEIQKCLESIELAKEKMIACDNALEESRENFKKAKDEMAQSEKVVEALSDDLCKIRSRMRGVRRDLETAKQTLDNANAELEGKRVAVERAKESAAGGGECPENVNFKEHGSKELQKRATMLKEQLKAQQTRRGGRTAEEIEREYLKAKAQHQDNARRYVRVRQYHRSVKKGLYMREEKFKSIEKSLKKMIRANFRQFLSYRNHSGNISFNMDANGNKQLVITAKMASHAKGDGERHETVDLRSLSGGERSFTTLCFMMALAEICLNPIRVMDEIDVYQDEANRRVSFKILIDFFQNILSDRQVIIITPHSLPPNINSTHTCRVVRLEDPRREGEGQTRIDDYIETAAD